MAPSYPAPAPLSANKGNDFELRDRQGAAKRHALAVLPTDNASIVVAMPQEFGRVVDVRMDDTNVPKAERNQAIRRGCVDGPESGAAVKRVDRTGGKPLRPAGDRARCDGRP